MTRLDVVVPSANAIDGVGRCLRSVLEHVEPERLGVVVVVDDAVEQRDFSGLTARFHVRVVPGPRQGPGAARNAGADIGASEYLLFIDDDMELTALDPGISSKHAVLVARLTAPDDSPAWLHRVYQRGVMVASGKAANETRLPGHALSTGGLLISRDVFQSLGGFPNTPHKRWEDALFGIAAEHAGYPPVVSARFRAVHHYVPRWAEWLRRLYIEGGNLRALEGVMAPPDFASILNATNLAGGIRGRVKRAAGAVPLPLWALAPYIRLERLAEAAAFARGFQTGTTAGTHRPRHPGPA